MSSSKLKLNPDKIEFIVFDCHEQRCKLNPLFPVNILDNLLLPAQKVKNLGVWFDAEVSLSDHVSSICRSSFLQLRELRRIRQYLSLDSARLVANALLPAALIIATFSYEVCLGQTYADSSVSKTVWRA